MSTFLRNRWLHGSLFIGVLIALGVGIYQVQPPEPMCEIEGDLRPRALLARDWLVTTAIPETPLILGGMFPCGSFSSPITVWDATSGAKLKTYFADKRPDCLVLTISKDGRRLAALEVAIDLSNAAEPVRARSLVMIDLDSGAIKEFALDETVPFNGGAHQYRVWFSAEGTYVVLSGKRGALRLFKFATGRLVSQFEGHRLCLHDNGRVIDDDFSDELLVYMQATEGGRRLTSLASSIRAPASRCRCRAVSSMSTGAARIGDTPSCGDPRKTAGIGLCGMCARGKSRGNSRRTSATIFRTTGST
jgi:hypothetical protein